MAATPQRNRQAGRAKAERQRRATTMDMADAEAQALAPVVRFSSCSFSRSLKLSLV